MRRLCEAQGLSQVKLAAKVKMGRSRWNTIERAKRDVFLTTVVRIAAV